MPSRRDLRRRRDLCRRTRHPRGGTGFTLAGLPTYMFDLEHGRRTGHSLERAWKVTVVPMDSQHLSRAYALLTVYNRSEEHTSELQSLMRISYAVFCLTTKH